MTTAKELQTVSFLQQACANSFTEIMVTLQVGMSEQDIADALKAQMAKHGVKDYWYDVPFVVLTGPERFRVGTTITDYAVKAPSVKTSLREGDIIYADFAPMDTKTGIWGDWSSNCVFRPTTGRDQEKMKFLSEMRQLHREGISRITANTTGADVATFFLDQFALRDVELLDVRNNVGHSIHAGAKSQAKRIWLDLDNTQSLGQGIFAVEPGGIRRSDDAFARFEECILIPEVGPAIIIGSGTTVNRG